MSNLPPLTRRTAVFGLAAAAVACTPKMVAPSAPIDLVRSGPKIGEILAKAPALSPPGASGPVLHWVSFRQCPPCIAFKKMGLPQVRAAGIAPRAILYALPDKLGVSRSSAEERATLAQLALTRDWDLYEKWYSNPADPSAFYQGADMAPPADTPERAALVEAGRKVVEDLRAALALDKIGWGTPFFFWRKKETWRVSSGFQSQSTIGYVLADLRPDLAP